MLGEVIHGYRVDRALSADKGGFGDVFFATHVDSGAEAVVKVLKPEMSALRDIVARFFNEARAAASIHHPGIVQIHNVGYHGDRAYLLMERLRGDDLETRLAAGPLPVERAVVFLRQTAGAIGAAHERGIVHRDLKPANLFVVADPDVVGGERVKVLDFGIAKLTVDSGAGKTQGVFGTPSYMSPEQCASAGAVDARADLYSLGCIFYELVCGRPPFGHGGLELIAAHLRDTPPPPRALAPWLPPAIEQVILQLLEKQPDRRYPSAAALVAALDEAAAASGLMSASVPHLPVAGSVGAAPYAPSGGPFTQRVPSPSTLGSAAGAASTQPARKQSLGMWLGIGAIVVVGGAVAAVMAAGGGHAGPPPPSGPRDASVVSTAPADAAPLAAVVPDAALGVAAQDAAVALVVADAAPVAAVAPDAGPSRSQGLIAAELNDEGRIAMSAARYEEAATRFSDAAARDPDPKYLFNLAVARAQSGHLDEAVTAIHGVLASSPPPPEVLASKARRLLEKVKEIARSQGIELHAPDPGVQTKPTATASATITEQAAQLFKQGDDAFHAERFEDALQLYQRAYELEPGDWLLLGIGRAQQRTGRCPEARRSFQRLIGTWGSSRAAQLAASDLKALACESR